MDAKLLVDQYLSAWNRQDIAGLLELCAADASYYDTFWMERCPRAELEEYLRESFEEISYWYRLAGEPIVLGNGVTYRYTAHEVQGSAVGRVHHEGADMLIVCDGKIVSMTDYYWNPDPDVLAEVAKTTASRQGRPHTVRYGLHARRACRFRNRIATLLDKEQLFLDPNLTLSRVADKLGAPVNQLTEVISTYFGSNFYSLLDQRRAAYARDLLLKDSGDPDNLYRVAIEAGFRSFERFNQSFKRFFDLTPAEFRRSHSQ